MRISERTFKLTKLFYQHLQPKGKDISLLTELANALTEQGFIQIILGAPIRYRETPKLACRNHDKEFFSTIDSVLKGTYGKHTIGASKLSTHYLEIDGSSLGMIEVAIKLNQSGEIVDCRTIYENLEPYLGDFDREDIMEAIAAARQAEAIEQEIDIAKEDY